MNSAPSRIRGLKALQYSRETGFICNENAFRALVCDPDSRSTPSVGSFDSLPGLEAISNLHTLQQTVKTLNEVRSTVQARQWRQRGAPSTCSGVPPVRNRLLPHAERAHVDSVKPSTRPQTQASRIEKASVLPGGTASSSLPPGLLLVLPDSSDPASTETKSKNNGTSSYARLSSLGQGENVAYEKDRLRAETSMSGARRRWDTDFPCVANSPTINLNETWSTSHEVTGEEGFDDGSVAYPSHTRHVARNRMIKGTTNHTPPSIVHNAPMQQRPHMQASKQRKKQVIPLPHHEQWSAGKTNSVDTRHSATWTCGGNKNTSTSSCLLDMDAGLSHPGLLVPCDGTHPVKVPDYSTLSFWGKLDTMDTMQRDLSWCAHSAIAWGERVNEQFQQERESRMDATERAHRIVSFCLQHQTVLESLLAKEREANVAQKVQNDYQLAKLEELRTYMTGVEASSLTNLRLYENANKRLRSVQEECDVQVRTLTRDLEELRELYDRACSERDAARSELSVVQKKADQLHRDLVKIKCELAGGCVHALLGQLLHDEPHSFPKRIHRMHSDTNTGLEPLVHTLKARHTRCRRYRNSLSCMEMYLLKAHDVDATGSGRNSSAKQSSGRGHRASCATPPIPPPPSRLLSSESLPVPAVLPLVKLVRENLPSLDERIAACDAWKALQMWRWSVDKMVHYSEVCTLAMSTIWLDTIGTNPPSLSTMQEKIHESLLQASQVLQENFQADIFVKLYLAGVEELLSKM